MIQAFVGPNRYALQLELNKAKADFAKKHGELAVESFDAEEAELNDIQNSLQTISLFTSTKMVVVRSLSDNKQAAEQIEELIDMTPEEVSLAIVEPKPDKRSTYYKTLKKRTDIQEFTEPDETVLVDWLLSEAKTHGAQLSRSDSMYLINRVGVNQARVASDLRKLMDFNPKITRENIDLLTEPNPQDTVFDLLNATFGRDTKRALRLYDQLRTNGAQPGMIMSMIVWQMHLITLVAAAGDKSVDEIASGSGAKTFTINKSQNIARKLSTAQIKQLLNDLAKLDQQLKSQPIDPDEGLKNLILKIATS